MARANRKSIIEYNGQKIPFEITYDGIRTRTNQYNEQVPYRDIRGKITTSEMFHAGAVVMLEGKEMRVTYYNDANRPHDISLTDNVIGL